MDDDTFAFLQESIAREVGLPEGWAVRLRGSSVSELRRDGETLMRTLGLRESESSAARDEVGRFAASPNDAMNRAIRRAAFGGNYAPEASDESEPPVGKLGAGRGGTNPPVKPDMSALIRAASGR